MFLSAFGDVFALLGMLYVLIVILSNIYDSITDRKWRKKVNAEREKTAAQEAT